ncbi:hypothetical protein [Sulfuracidifex tepidarius]|uniref:Uncharacterized protein n=1 Tax=Sulfuracidifex tepidarius TaxID=1294262 RepID=A0A510DVZ6_9CREN|nr:hypothetical protein [Sulfuracidifex tepidarius]BBG24354.1 hypothetical protein IC006_1665 [Sulfuracidifex tepidarius]BBG27112.1 hypothetical protein IC007_1643 [Sulfuracidifex tepidarius]
MELDDVVRLAKAGRMFSAMNFLKDFVINNESSINTNEKVCEDIVKMIKRFPSLNESWEVFVGNIDVNEVLRLVEVVRLCLK